MSFIVKGIDLPRDTEGISVTFYTKDGWRETHILDVTQAIQIPKGHGRLIDESDLDKDTEWSDYLDDYQSYSFTAIQDAPTILDSEE